MTDDTRAFPLTTWTSVTNIKLWEIICSSDPYSSRNPNHKQHSPYTMVYYMTTFIRIKQSKKNKK